jgi:hypothetical protein
MRDLVFYDADGATPIPQESLTAVRGGATGTPAKVGLKAIGDEDWGAAFRAIRSAIADNDGAPMLKIGVDSVTLSPPWDFAGEVSAPGNGGTWGGVGRVEASVTAYNGTGETIRSAPAQAYVADVTSKITWSWARVTGASGYRVYRPSAPGGSYTTPCLVGVTAGEGTLSLDDTGDTLSSGAPPATNTTGGGGPLYYVSPPSLGAGPAMLGACAVGQWKFLVMQADVPSGKNALGNPRLIGIDFDDS